MLLDVDILEARKTISDHYGVYHSYQSDDQIRSFLMFCCTSRAEALRLGEEVAKVLKVPFKDRLPVLTPREKAEEEKIETDKVANSSPALYGTYEVRHGRAGRSGTAASSSGGSGAGSGKKTKGVGSKVRELIAQGLADDEIVNQCIPLYTEAGKTETVARNLLKPYVKEIRGLESKKKTSGMVE